MKSSRTLGANPAALLCVIFAGCLYSEGGKRPEPARGIERAAERSANGYAKLLAGVCDETAKRIEENEFKGQAQVFQHFQKRSAEAREKAMAVWESEFNRDVPPGRDLQIEETARAYREAAKGFRRAAK